MLVFDIDSDINVGIGIASDILLLVFDMSGDINCWH